MEDPELWVRHSALDLLRDIPGEPTAEGWRVVELALNEDSPRLIDPAIQYTVMHITPAVGPRFAKRLIELLDSPDKNIRGWAGGSLARSRNEAILPRALADLKSPELAIAQSGAGLLAIFGTDAAVEPVLTIVNDESQPLERRKWLLSALSDTENHGALATFRKYESDPQFHSIRPTIKGAIAKLTGQPKPDPFR